MIIFLHGLESSPISAKSDFIHDYFENSWRPEVNYYDPEIFDKLSNKIEEYGNKHKVLPKLIIGSSMGGYFGYWLGKKYGINTCLFNPALPYRSIESSANEYGKSEQKNIIILGLKDDVIEPDMTIKWLKENEKNYVIKYESTMGHRIPQDIFEKYIRQLR